MMIRDNKFYPKICSKFESDIKKYKKSIESIEVKKNEKNDKYFLRKDKMRIRCICRLILDRIEFILNQQHDESTDSKINIWSGNDNIINAVVKTLKVLSALQDSENRSSTSKTSNHSTQLSRDDFSDEDIKNMLDAYNDLQSKVDNKMDNMLK